MRKPDIKTAEEFLVPANNAKNRYVNIPLSKTSRVVLKGEGPVDTYIHANFIPGTDSNEDYIVTQSPLPETVKDFWSMVYHEGVTNIVMVCSFSVYIYYDVRKAFRIYPGRLSNILWKFNLHFVVRELVDIFLKRLKANGFINFEIITFKLNQ